ncbi:MAG: tol-pal system protein YbgF [Bradymonadia bacterium]
MKWVWLGVVLILSGCATQSGGFSERDRVLLEGRLEDLESAQARQKSKVTSLEKRVAQLEDMVSLLSRRTSLESREVVKIEPRMPSVPTVQDKGVEDDVYQEIVISEEKKRSYFGNTRSRSSSSASQPYENVVTNDRLPSSGSPSLEEKTPSGSSVSPMPFYQEGIDLYRQGNFVEARARFEKFLAAKPEESYIDNALYWIGECFYGEGLYHEAANYFHRIVQEYPKANKVPDALLKVSLTYQKLGKMDSAREMLRYLMEAFPGTEAARIGKEKYESWNASAK